MDSDTINSFLVKGSCNFRDTDVTSSIDFLKQRGFKLLRILGCGSFGAVFLAEQQSNKEKVAIKIIYARNEEEINNFLQEFSIMTKLESQFTAKLIDMLQDFKNRLFFLIMQYQPNGDLGAFISANPNLSSQKIANIFIEILRGLIYLKQNHIIHGDLKPQNILLSADNTPKLTDFGLSKRVLGIKSYTINNGGTYCYEAPEQQKNQKMYFESDWYSAGMILFNLCGNSDVNQMLAIKNGQFPDIANLRYKNIVELSYQMMSPSPKNRASPEQIIQKLKIMDQFDTFQTISSQQGQQQQQYQIEQQQSTISKSVYEEYVFLVKKGINELKLLEEKEEKKWWDLWKKEEKKWRLKKWDYKKDQWNQLCLVLDLQQEKEELFFYADTYEKWQGIKEEERQQQLRVLRKYIV